MYDVRGRWLGDVVRLRGHESVGKGEGGSGTREMLRKEEIVNSQGSGESGALKLQRNM